MIQKGILKSSVQISKAFVKLFDNYSAETGIDEDVTDEEIREERQFINACMNTRLMREAHRFLVDEGKAPEDVNEFKDFLIDIWFDFYSRSADEEYANF